MTTYDSPPPNDKVSPPEADERQARIRAKKARAKERLAERQAAAHEAMASLPVMPLGYVVLEEKYGKTNVEPWHRSTRIALREGWAALYRPRAKSRMLPVWAMSREYENALRKMERDEVAREIEQERRRKKEDREREEAEARVRHAAYWSDPANATRWTHFRPMQYDRALGCNQIEMLACLVAHGGTANVAVLARAMPSTKTMNGLHGFSKVKSIGMGLCRRGLVMPVGVTPEAPYPSGFAVVDAGRDALRDAQRADSADAQGHR